MKTDNKRKKIKKLVVIIVGVLAVIGVALAAAFAIDWEGVSVSPGHVHGDDCAH